MAVNYDVGRTFVAVENLVFEVCSWAVFVPKTLWRVVTDPEWVVPYVTGELDKEPRDRHLAYMPPVLLWLVAGVLPLVAIWWLLARGGTDTGWEDALWRGAGALGAMPCLVSAAVAPLGPGPVDRQRLRRVFESQCLAYTPLLVFALPTAWIVAKGWLPEGGDGNLLYAVSQARWDDLRDELLGPLALLPLAAGIASFTYAEHAILRALVGRRDDQRLSERLGVWVPIVATVSMFACLFLAATLLGPVTSR